MKHVSRRIFTACVAALALAWPLAAAEPQVSGGVAVQSATPVQAIREQIVAIDAPGGGRGTATLPMAGVSLTGSGLIVGQVVDASSGAPVANAIVSLGSSSPPAPVAGNASRGGAPAAAPPGAASAGRGSTAPPTVLRQLADSDGRFAFRHLPRGAYAITVTRPGYIDGAYGRLRPTGSPQPLELADGERRSDVKVRVFKYAAITGMLREESGDPAVGVNVRAYRRTVVGGRAQLSASAAVQTDDRGIYRLANLTPGDYIVAAPFASSTAPSRPPGEMSPEIRAQMQPGIPMGSGSIVPQTDRFVLGSTTASYGATLESNGTIMVTPTTYFPSALVASQAQPITIGSGEERAGVDIVLRTSSATFISGRLTGPDGPGADWALNLVPTDTGDLTTDPQVATAVTDSDGAFMFLGIPAGSYVIQGMRISAQAGPRVTTTMVNGQPMVLSTTGSNAAAAQPAQPTLWTATPVSVGPEGLRDLAVTLRRGFAVSGRIEFDGGAERPPAARLQTVTVTLEAADGRARGPMPGARVDGSGQFTSGGYLPGKYVVRVLNPPGGWTLKSVMLGATDVADLPLELDARDLSGLVVTFVDRSTELQGAVRDPKGQPDDDAAVGVFPIDSRLWTNAGTASRRMRMTRVSTTGRFTFAGLPPGEYGVVAFSEEFAGEWPDARFLDQLSRVATRVTLADGGKQSVDLARQTVRGGLLARKNTSGMFFRPTKNTSGMFFEADTAELEDFSPNSTDSDLIEPAGSEKHTRRVFASGESQQRDARVEPTVASSSGATISGSVIEDGSGQPIRRARVSVRASDARFDRAVMTDDAGRFVVSSVPPGRYSIIVTKPSFIAGYHGSKRPGRGPGTALAVTAGQKAQVSIPMARGAVITGVVRDESGAPMPNARVTAGIIRVQNGMRDIYQLGSAQTDDRGTYRIFGLAANNYYVFAAPSISTMDVRQLTGDDWQAVTNELRQTGAPAPAAAGTTRTPSGRPIGFASIFYPGTLSFADATAIPVGTGQEVTSIDLTARLVPTARIEGTVSAPDGRPLQGALLMMFPESVQTGVVTSITTQQDGRFASPFVPPGRYTLYVRANQNLMSQEHPADVMIVAPVIRSFPAVPAGAPPPPPPPPPPPMPPNQGNLYAELALDLAGENLTGVSIAVQEGTTVSGRVQFEGSRTIAPGAVFPVRVSMTNALPTRFSFGSASTSSNIGATFTIPGVPPGKMRFAGQAISNMAGPNQPPVPTVAGWMLKSATLNGRDVLDLPLDVAVGRSIDGVVLTFTDRMAELSGAVLDAAGGTNADLYVMLLPADRAYWATPTSRRFRAPVTTGLDGRYRFTNLPAGDYLLVALGDADGLDTTDPNVLEQLAAGGIKITIADGEKKTQDIRTR